MWLADKLVPSPASTNGIAETVSGMFFLFFVYASAPLYARFLAPVASGNQELQGRLSNVLASMPSTRPAFLYDHDDQNANTVGLLAYHSQVYLTTGLMKHISDEGLKGILAHEETHVRERHILMTFCYSCSFTMLAQLFHSNATLALGFLLYLTLSRHFEYRADAGGAKLVGKATMLAGLHDLHTMYPSKKSQRWFVFAMAYPTLPMRIKALETGRRPLF